MTEFTLTGTETFVPEGTTILYVQNYKLTSLPPLPPSLEKLYCDENQLTSLPPLPLSLKYLYCENNQLTSLPPVPDSLNVLYCNGNLNTQEEMEMLSKIRTNVLYRKVLYKLKQRNSERRAHLFVLLAQINSRPEKVIAVWDQGGIFYQESLLEFEKFV